MGLVDVLIIILCLAMLFGSICVPMWFARIYRRRIRRWADEHGYAIVRLTYKWVSTPTRVVVGDLGTWFVEIQDEQGGIRRAYVHFPCFRHIWPWMDVPWGKMQIVWR